MYLIVSIISFAMFVLIVGGIIRSLQTARNVASEKPVEETSEMKLRRAYMNAYFMQMSLADEDKTTSEKPDNKS